jgi:hypothetical protein
VLDLVVVVAVAVVLLLKISLLPLLDVSSCG